MAGVTDLPFRRLCKRMGAGAVVSEMVTSDPLLQNSRKTRLRLAQDIDLSEDREGNTSEKQHQSEPGLRIVQIAGGDAEILSQAAISNVEKGAQVIDINMGCPAKKVCKKAAGSALLKDPKLVEKILYKVVASVDVPVTLKIRTGWDQDNKNALHIAQLAEDAGIQLLAVHGRTRACKYKGSAEHETVAAVKQLVNIPVVANGDIISPEQARKVLDQTKVDGLMIGRAAQGRPWIFREIDHYLKHGHHLPKIEKTEVEQVLLQHVSALHDFYGEHQGVRIARKHTSWYLAETKTSNQQTAQTFRKKFNYLLSADEQLEALTDYFKQ